MPAHLQSHLNGIFRPRLIPTGSEAVAAVGPLVTDLIGHWDLSEASGTRLDSTAFASHMAFEGTIGTDIGSAAGVGAGQTAAQFAGGNYQCLTASKSTIDYSIGTSPFLINFWSRVEVLPSDWGPPLLSTAPSPVNSNGGWTVTTKSFGGDYRAGSVLNWRLADNSGFTQGFNQGNVSTIDTWRMNTLFFNPATNLLYVFVNGGEFLDTPEAMTGSISASMGFYIGYLVQCRLQSLSIWKGDYAKTIAGSVGDRPIIDWLYNSGTAARLYSDIAAYGT